MLKELWRYLQCLQQTEAKEEKLKHQQLIIHRNAEGKSVSMGQIYKETYLDS